MEEKNMKHGVYEDEIDILDLWRAIVRQKQVVVGTIVACLLIGGLYAFLMPERYAFTTSIEIGKNSGGKLIDDPRTASSKLSDGYIPLTIKEFHDTHPDNDGSYEIQAISSKKSELVLMKAQGRQDEAETYLQLLSSALARLQTDHGRILKVIQNNLDVHLNTARNIAEALLDKADVLAARKKLFAETRKLLQKQIAELQDLTRKAMINRKQAVKEAQDASQGMTMLMIDQGIQQNRNRLATLEERLYVKLEDSSNQLEKSMADNKRNQVEQQIKIRQIQAMISNLQETRAIVPPMQSLRPVAPNRPLILGLAGVLGLIFGIFAAVVRDASQRRKSIPRKTGAIQNSK